jgi:hypothetical protein
MMSARSEEVDLMDWGCDNASRRGAEEEVEEVKVSGWLIERREARDELGSSREDQGVRG